LQSIRQNPAHFGENITVCPVEDNNLPVMMQNGFD
jgi:hypothetical protein